MGSDPALSFSRRVVSKMLLGASAASLFKSRQTPKVQATGVQGTAL
jgi:hypothetical protein